MICAIIPAPYQPARHDKFVEIAKKGDIDVLFDGDSITDFWATNGKDVFPKYFGGWKLANFAISGDTTQGVLYRLQHGEGQGFSPKAIMLMIGTNNTGRNTAVEIADGIIADVNELRKDFPAAKILLLAVFPRGLPNDPARKTIADINAMIAKLDDQKHIFYLDIGPKFLGADGAFLPDVFLPDNLHPKAAGYEIWGAAVKDKLLELMK
jgi:lysophospholipase L1-like esterase